MPGSCTPRPSPYSREPCRSAVERAFQLAIEHEKIISLDPNYSPVIWPDYREAMEVIEHMLKSYNDHQAFAR